MVMAIVCGDNNYTSRCHAIKTLFVQNHGTELKRKWWRTYWLHASSVVVLRQRKKKMFKKYLAGWLALRVYWRTLFALHPSLRIGRTPFRVKFNTTRAVTWLKDTPTFMIVVYPVTQMGNKGTEMELELELEEWISTFPVGQRCALYTLPYKQYG